MSAITSTRGTVRPPVAPGDVKIGVYLADVPGRKLLRVADVHSAQRGFRQVRLAMLEDAVTGQIEPWEFGDLRRLRLVRSPDG